MKSTPYYISLTMDCLFRANGRLLNFLVTRSKLLQVFVLFSFFIFIPVTTFGQAAASFNYTTETGTLGTTYSWIDCSTGTSIVSGDDAQASFSWPFAFSFYDNGYTTANSISVSTNGFIRLDGTASTSYSAASGYTLSSTSTELGQIIATSVYDCNVEGTASSWVKYLVTGSSPNRILTIEFSDIEIDYNDGLYANVQVSFYETLNEVVLKFGTDNVTVSGADMGIHSGVSGYYDYWQDVANGTNNTWIKYIPTAAPPSGPQASWNYDLRIGVLGTTYSWIDCTSGSSVVSGDDAQAQVNWPFDFNMYDNSYTTADNLSVATNGFIRIDGVASTDYGAASAYDLTATATNLGQIIAIAVYDDDVSASSWVRSLTTGTAPNRIFTIEYNNLEIDYNDLKYADVQVSFYESSNKIVLKFGTDNITATGVDMGIHSGVDTYFDKWQEVLTGTNNSWIEYAPPIVEVNATSGTTLAYYSTLKGAFDKINDGTHQQDITIKIKDNTTEASAAVLYASGTGSSNYASVNIYPTVTGLSISGNLSSPLIDLNGADNVTIDGRVNASGTITDLSIINTSVASVTGTSTIRFIDAASNNTVKYCTIKGSETKATSGIILFSTTTHSNGNNGNTIDNNNITSSDAAYRPVNAIFSEGTVGKDNSGNIISNNNIYDFLKHATASNGIYLTSNNTAWTIDGNSFYETASYSPTGTVTYHAIKIINISGNGFIITNNYIGGSTAQCGGSAWTKTNLANNVFYAIDINVGNTVVSSIQNNTIQNFSWSNSGIAIWAAINVGGGSVDIGTVTGNTIGATTGTNSISVSGGTNGQSIYGIKVLSTDVINCENNSIGSITGSTVSSYSTHIYGIELSGTSVADITNNIIGSTTTGSSIYASSASTANVQKVYGIYSKNTGTLTIHENTISNLRNNTSNTAVGTSGFIYGIYITAGENMVHNNIVRDISIANANTSTYSPSVVGIFLFTITDTQSIYENLIYNISNTYPSFIGSVIGLYVKNSLGSAAGDVYSNFIYNISVDDNSTGANVYGIFENSDLITYSNNIINLGGSTSSNLCGIYDQGNVDKTVSLFFNSIYISGTNSGAEKSYAVRYNTNSSTRDLRNNILFNARSGGSGSHYALYYDATGGTYTADYNDYYTSGTEGMIAYYGGNKSTLALLQTATGQDANSLNTDPVFASPGGTDPDDYITAVSLPGVAGTGITTDYEGITRDDPPKMGALESSLDFIWQGNTSTDFALAANWENGFVPPNGAEISFAATPSNDCYLDQNRTLSNITNTSSRKLFVNGKQLTLTGNIVSATANQIDATTASLVFIFSGPAAQSIPNGVFVSNTIDALTLNNSHGLTLNGDITIPTALTLTAGALTIGANTLTLNGAVSTTSGTLVGGSTTNIVVGGSGASTILPGVELNNLTLNRANGISTGGNISVAGTLALTNGTLTLGANTLTISGNTPTRTSGNIDAGNASSTLVFSNSSAIMLDALLFTGNINNMTIGGAGITAGSDLSVNGILNLQSANPSDIKGLIDMGTYTLLMGANATTTGTGDVTGRVKRTTILANIEYTFGNRYSSITFPEVGTLPTEITLKISIGVTPTWKTGGVKRVYDIAQTGASGTRGILKSHYLDSELNGNEEINISFFSYIFPSTTLLDRGRTEINTSENWVTLNNTDFGNLPAVFGVIEHGFGVSTSNVITWDGSESTDWFDPYNWLPAFSPDSTKIVIIPNATTTPNSPLIDDSNSDTISTMTIQPGGILTAGANTQLVLKGSSGAWSNNGTFNAGTSNVIFNHGVPSNVVTIAGTTNFYDIEAGPNTTMQPTSGCVLRIAGVGMAYETSIVDFSAIDNTVEWNGTDQTIVNPNGIAGNSGYYKLILSGSGTKTMPITAMNIEDELKLSGTVTATAQAPLTIGVELEILEDATFATGNFDHTIGGPFDNRGTFIASAGTNITLNGTTVQEIYGGSPTTFEKLTINNPAGVDIFTDITVNDTLMLVSGNLNVAATTLTINGEISKTAGFINFSTLSSLTFGGTTALMTTANLFASTPNINNLTINRTGGVELCCDFTVNGSLSLQSANPSGTKGCLDMGTNTLLMGDTATTIGIGDVTGRVKRTTILANTEYTFGHQYSSVTFPDIGTLPTEITVKISIGIVPSWKADAIKRVVDISQIGGSGTKGTIKSHYLDSELNGNEEVNLSYFSYIFPSTTLLDRGLSDLNTTENWISLNNADFANLPPVFGVIEHGFGVSISNVITWDGSESTDWFDQYNWTPAFIPDSTKRVVIPDSATTPRDPVIIDSSSDTISSLSIQSGGILTAGAGSQITIDGASGAWSNNGTFNASTGKIIFNHGIPSEVVTISGTTNFYDIEAGENTTMQPVPGCILRIAGTGMAYETSVVDFNSINNTVEWNGADQYIVNPNGIGGHSGYYNLILSGSGTKTMPTTEMTIHGDFKTSGTTTVPAGDTLIILGDFTIDNSSTFGTGSYPHFLEGNFENNGTFTASTGGNIIFNGISAQTISGTSTTTFDKLTTNNTAGVSQSSLVIVTNILALNNGNLTVGNTTLGINGTISNPAGNLDVSSVSSLSFGGTSAITLNNNLFSADPTINNLSINRSGGITLGNQNLTVNGTLTLTDGTLTIAANTLTLTGGTPALTSGNIDASDSDATLTFENPDAVILPASFFNGNVNNLTINGSGITAGSDLAIVGVLFLQSVNPSATKGSLDMSTFTLNMGADATTVGAGDVTGIVKRAHTFANGIEYSFGNQYTTLNFLDVPGNTKPSWISLKIEIGAAPVWRSEAVKRFYSFAQDPAGNDRLYTKLHYLDSELNAPETDESEITVWNDYDGVATGDNTFVNGKTDYNSTENWIGLVGMANDFIAPSTTFAKQYGLGYSDVSIITWTGLGSVSYPGDWSLPGHWSGGVPDSEDSVLISSSLPQGSSGYPYQNLLPVLSPALALTIEIESGATINVDDYDITVSGFGDAWVNNGTFSPGTGTVIFNHSDENEIVNLKGTTNFNNLTVEDKTHIKAATNCITRIAGILSAHSGSILDFTDNINTVEYNGSGAQTVVNPTTATTPGYHHLIVSGGGTKTLPASSLNILGDFTANTVISATGDTLVMNGTAAQSIDGSVTPALDNFINSNTSATVTANVSIDCSSELINSGELDMTTYDLAVAGTVTNSGTVKTASITSTPLPPGKLWGGVVKYYNSAGGQTVMAGTYNNLTLSNTSGTQNAIGNLTVNGTLTTTSGGFLNMVTNQLFGTLSTIANGGTIQTQNTGTTPIPTGKTWGGTVQYNTTTGGQTIMAGTYSTLTLSNTSGTQTASGTIAATTLNTLSDGTFNMVTYAISGLTTLSNLGTFRTQNISTTPFTSGLNWGGTVIFDGTEGQTLPTTASIFNNLTISNTEGVAAATNQTVNGILNLSVANPNDTTGSLDMDSYTLYLGENSTTIGTGDVTGIITRTSFTTNTTYTYGNANQYVLFPVVSGQTLPTSFSLRITLLATAPDWVPNATKRLYEIAQTGGVNTKATFRTNYLDSELASGVEESLLSFWQNVYPFDPEDVLERGWSDYNSEENWITFSDANFGVIPGTMGYFKITIAPTQFELRTWNGSQSTTAWNTATNWTPQGIPSASLGIIIPDVDSSNNYSPDIPVGATGKYLIIQDEGILNAATGATLALYGNGNAWSMEPGGDFNPGNSNVSFVGDTAAGVVRAAGVTDFYELTIADSTTFRPGVNAYIGIAGTLTNNGILDAATNHNTIEFKKDATFTIPNPNGTNPGYHTLIISGSGTKTLPTPLYIWHDFVNNGTVAAGTGSVTFDGLHSGQVIGGSSTTGFYDLTIANNSWEVTTDANITVSNTLTINSNTILSPGAAFTVGGTGTLTGSGTAKVTRITTTPDMATQYPIANKTFTNLIVDYCGAGDQTVTPFYYGDLLLSANGSRTITFSTSDTIGISGALLPDVSTTSYITTGSTLEANGLGAQTVPAFNFHNIVLSGDRGGETVTLVNGGTIGIAGHGSVTATNVNYEITNNTIDINGSGAQTLDKFSFFYLRISNSGTKTAIDTLVVYAGFTVEAGLTLDMATSPLMGPMGVISNSGIVKTANSTSITPIPAGKTWGGTIEYSGSSNQSIVSGTYNNLTMSGAGGGTLTDDITVDSVLNLSHANPLSTQGILDTGSDTLFMGESATTSGAGDVTGIVKRYHTFDNGVEYSFGNQYTTLNFLNVPGNVKPSWISCKIEIGAAPVWRSEAVKRYYSFAQDTIGTDRLFTKLHYLDSELNVAEPDESKLTVWNDYDGLATGDNTFVNGHTSYNSTENWVGLVGMANDFIAPADTFAKQYGLGYSDVSVITWTGLGSFSYPGDWSLPGHWSGGVPDDEDDVLIPATLPVGSSGYPNRNLLPVISPSAVKTIEIEPGGQINASDYDITISGFTDAWVNNGTFIAGTAAVIFNNGSTSNAVEIEGTTNFYNLLVNDNTKVQPVTNSISRIAGTVTAGSGSILDFGANPNTIEYNGSSAQTVIDPGTGNGYHNLIFSGSGTKTLPSSSLKIFGNLTFNTDILSSGNTLLMEGSGTQYIDGSSSASLNNLTIDNAIGVILNAEELATVNGTLLINSGKKFEVAAGQELSVSGSLTNNAGVSGFVLHSDASGTASSLIHKTDDVPATMQRYISGNSEDWHFLSSPVSNQSISGDWLPSGTYGNGTGYDLYLWNEPTSCWIYKLNTTSPVNWTTVHSGTNFTVGQGYLYSVEALNPIKSFAGNLVHGDVSVGLTTNSSDPLLQGFNFVGNPYPSSIDWMAASGWTFTSLVETGGGYDMWIWNPSANNYGVYNSADIDGIGTNSVTRYIAPMQGFFVQAITSGNLGMSNAIRVHNGAGNWFKNQSTQLNEISMSVVSDTGLGSDEILFCFGYPTNESGALKLFSHVKTAPGLYMALNNEDHSVAYFTSPEETLQIPVNFIAGKEGSFTLNFNFEHEYFEYIWLEDRKEKFIVDVKLINEYKFKAEVTDNKNRFVLHFGSTEPHSYTELPASIYYDDNELVIDLSMVDQNATVQLIDLSGRVLFKQDIEGKMKNKIQVPMSKQIVLVYVSTPDAFVCRKLFMKL